MLLTRQTLPKTIPDIAALDDLLCQPTQALVDDLATVDGDILILGVAGKMGPTLAGLAKAAGPHRRGGGGGPRPAGDRRGPIQRGGRKGLAARARRRDHQLRSAGRERVARIAAGPERHL